MIEYVILGGIGNGSVIAAAIEHAASTGMNVKFLGFLNDRFDSSSCIEGYPVLGKTSDVSDFTSNGVKIINTIFRIDGNLARLEYIESLGIDVNSLGTFIHPTAYVPSDVEIGSGVVVMPQVLISPGAKIGNQCLLMVGCSIGHNTQLFSKVHIAAQAVLGSHNKISEGCHIGLNATTRENISMGRNSTLGMGSVLTKNILEGEIWVGNPALFLRKSGE